MYEQMSPELPGQMYAELVRARAQQRLAQQTTTQRRTTPARYRAKPSGLSRQSRPQRVPDPVATASRVST